MKSLILAAAAAAWLASPAFAGEYNCFSTDHRFGGYLVFDDGPGGLDHASLQYLGNEYLLPKWDSDKNPKHFNVSDRSTPNGKYEYDGGEVALTLTGDDGTTFTLDASASSPECRFLNGTVAITQKLTRPVALQLYCHRL